MAEISVFGEGVKMKGIVKAVIAGGVIIGIGIIILLIGLSVNGWSIGFVEFEMNRYEAVEVNTSLEVDFGAGSLKTVFYDGEKIAVDYPTANGYTTEIKEKNGKLSFNTKVAMFSFGLGKWEIPETTIYLPKDTLFNLDFDLGAGTVKVDGGSFRGIKIEVGAGDFILGDTTCESFNAKVSAGKLSINSLVCEDLDAKVSAGELKIDSLLCPDIEANVSAGSVKICVDGAKADYNISVSVSAGSCNLNPQTVASDKKINAKVSAGSINITFTK